MIRKLLLVSAPLVPALAFAAALPNGRSIVEHGNAAGAPPCSTCHGSALQGNVTMKAPAIAGLPASKILDRLAHYASAQGHNAAMKAVATALTPPERVAVAAYVSHLPAKTGAVR